MQQGVCDAIHAAVKGVQRSFDDASEVVNKRSGSTVGHVKRGDLAKLASTYTHAAKCEAKKDSAKAASDGWAVLMSDTPRISAHASPGAIDSCDFTGRC